MKENDKEVCTCTIACIPQGLVGEQICRLWVEGSAKARRALMVEFYVEPWDEPDGTLSWCVSRIIYRPRGYERCVVSRHETRREAQEECDRLAA